MDIRAHLGRFKLRLTDLSQRNRSLRHVRLSPYRDADLMAFSFLEGEGAPALLERIQQGKRVFLMRGLKANHPDFAPLDTRLSRIYRELRLVFEENGTYDFYLGYPYVEGRFVDGTVARAPLALLPVRLVRHEEGQRWALEARESADTILNEVFLRAFEKYNRLILPPEIWETDFGPHFADTAAFLNQLFSVQTRFGLNLEFPSELFQHPLAPFREYRADYLALQPQGVLRVTGHATLGIFPQSYSALLEDYRELDERAEAFPVTGFFGGAKLAPTPPPPETDRFIGLPIDQDQEDALLALRQGHNLVVYGPPGTGKSQFIVNTVMDYLARGQKVLVVSQKRAALDVVHERLVDTHLAPFSYLLHDHRADRPAVYRHLTQMLGRLGQLAEDIRHLNMDKWREDFVQIAQRVDEWVAEDEARTRLMTQPLPCGHSVWELYVLAGGWVNTHRVTVSPWAERMNRHHLDTLCEVLTELRAIPVVWDAAHPWHHRLPLAQLTLEDRNAWGEWLGKLPAIAKELRGLRTQLSDDGNFWFANPEVFAERLARRRADYKSVAEDDTTRSAYEAWAIGGFDTKGHLAELDLLGEIAAGFARLRLIRMEEDPPLAEWQRCAEYYLAGLKRTFRWFDGRWRRERKWLKVYFASRQQVFDIKLVANFKNECEAARQSLERAGRPNFELFWVELPPSRRFAEWQAYLDRRRNLLQRLEALLRDDFFPTQWPKAGEGPEGWQRMHTAADALEQAANRYTQLSESLNERLAPAQQVTLWNEVESIVIQTDELQKLAASFLTDFHDLLAADRALERLPKDARAIATQVLPTLPTLGEQWERAVRNAFHSAWLAEAERNYPVLSTVTGGHFATRLEVFRTQLLRKQAVARDVVQFVLRTEVIGAQEVNRLGNAVNYREIAHQVGKKRQIWPIRKLMQRYWNNGLSELMPCILASPETVSAVFPMEPGLFDLVIFDEASQCAVERALPTVLRGKQVAVAGDDKQLPPSDLFAARAEELETDLETPTEMAVEAESLLHLGRQYFREAFLGWHYRSHTQALIEFSNERFYEGRLKSVPAPLPDAAFAPVMEYRLVNGEWKNNQNLIEAEAIVDELLCLLHHPERPTIGVVTFNQPQQEAIWEALEARQDTLLLQRDMETLGLLQRALTREHHQAFEGIFVKNIENVQGDERDVILFSVGYASGADGKVRAQFGLLNQAGGENRLNVAVTRARRKVIIVASLRPDQLNVDHTLNPGPRLFRDYLAYVWGKQGVAGRTETAANGLQLTGNNPILSQIAERLKTDGIPHSIGIGNASFALDIVLNHPERPAEAVIGVQVEGPMYFTGRSAKERLAYRPAALLARGWRLHTVYARNWWLDADAEYNRLKALYNKHL